MSSKIYDNFMESIKQAEQCLCGKIVGGQCPVHRTYLRQEYDDLRARVAVLEGERDRLSARDCNATVQLCYGGKPEGYPFQYEDLKVVDVGVADNVYVVESAKFATLQAQVDKLTELVVEGLPHFSTVGWDARHTAKWNANMKGCHEASKKLREFLGIEDVSAKAALTGKVE